MRATPSTLSELDRTHPDAWPWRCLGCGGTIFHDVEFCRDCESTRPPPEQPPPLEVPEEFLEWMRNEPRPTFSAKVTAITGIELLLTTLWLELLLRGPVELARLGVLVGS